MTQKSVRLALHFIQMRALIILVLAATITAVTAKRFFISRWGACRDCGYHGKSYQWCYLGARYHDWDYCSTIPGHTTRDEECRPDHECDFHGENYLWCYKRNGGWDYCSHIEDTNLLEYTTGGNDCHNYCDLENSKYVCRKYDKDSTDCSPAEGITSKGYGCMAQTGEGTYSCGFHGYGTMSCHASNGQSLQCSHIGYDSSNANCNTNIRHVHLSDGDVITLERIYYTHHFLNVGDIITTTFYSEKSHNQFRRVLKEAIADAKILVFDWHNKKRTSYGSTRLSSKDFRSTPSHGIFRTWQIIKNLELPYGDNVIAEVNIPRQLEFHYPRAYERRLVQALYYSLIRKIPIWIIQDRNDEGDGESNYKNSGRFVFMSEGNKPYASDAMFEIRQAATGIVFQLPTKVYAKCLDDRWTHELLTSVVADVENSETCLDIIWGNATSANENRNNDLVWTISGSSKKCPDRKSLSRCRITTGFNDVENYTPIDSVFANIIDLDTIPEPYTSQYISPSLRVHLKDKPPYEIPFSRSWKRPLFNSSAGVDKIIDNVYKIVFICPGFLSDNNVDWVMEMKDKILNHHPRRDVAVITVGWEKGAHLWLWQYTQAVANTQVVGEYLGNMVRQLKTDLPYTIVWGIGFSLGAHIMGKAGRTSGSQFDRITGLDPAGPSFETVFKPNRLQMHDAHFVEVIHTDGIKMTFSSKPNEVGNTRFEDVDPERVTKEDFFNPVGHYGTMMKCGHVDFYINWGYEQPTGLISWNPFGMKSHERAHELYTWTISHPDTMLSDVRILGNPSKSELPNKWVRSEILLEMGYHSAPVYVANYYLKTSDKPPWVDPPKFHIGTEQVIETMQVGDCTDRNNPRVRSLTDGRHRKFEVYAHSGEGAWSLLYTVYWNTEQIGPTLTVHQIPPDARRGDIANENNEFLVSSAPSFTHHLCSHGLGTPMPNVDPGSPEDSEKLANEFAGLYPGIDSLYTQATQTKSLQVQGVIGVNRDFYFQKGHLVPNADFEGDVQRKATYLYINASPQWNRANNGNWKKIEKFLRERASQPNFWIYTLPLGHYTSPNGEPVRLSSLLERDTWDSVPVPAKFAKVVVRDDNRCANTYIVHNRVSDEGSNIGYCENVFEGEAVNERNGRVECFHGVPEEIRVILVGISGEIHARFIQHIPNHPCF